jgi:hypothetical protein
MLAGSGRPARRRRRSCRTTLEAAGVSFTGDTIDTGVCHMAFFADPGGNQLLLHARYVPRT